MKQPKFKGYSRETNSWHYGYGWFNADFTTDYLKEKNLPEQATLLTESGAIYCDLSSMAQLIGTDCEGNEVYTQDILQPNMNEEKYTVVHFENASLFRRYHFENKFEGSVYEDKNDSPLHLKSHKVVGTVYEMGTPYHKRIGSSFKYEADFRK